MEQLTPWGELLSSHYYNLNEQQLKDILIQLTEGLIECRDKGITYSDIHYNNVFVSKDGGYKLGDFGTAYPTVADGSLPASIIGHDGIALGSRWFMSPETYHDHIFNESSAVYSLALLAYFVMNDMRLPFLSSAVSEQEALDKRFSYTPVDLPCKSSSFKVLSRVVCDILNAKPLTRIKTFEEFIAKLKDDSSDDIDGMSFSERLESLAKTISNGPKLSFDADTGCFAASPVPSTPSEPIDDGAYETDSFASMCGLNTESDYVVWDDSLWDDLEVTGSSYSPSRVTESRRPEICSCVYAPGEVRYNKSFIIRVYMYLPQEQDAVDSKVRDIDPSAVKKEYKPLDLPVKEGDKLTVQLDLSDGVQCTSTTKSVIWRNHFTDCSFMAKLVDASQDSIEGTAYVFVNDVPAGEMLFTIDVVESQPRELYTNVESHRFSKIFISYAHQDEIQVRGIAEGCRMLGKDYFFDRHTLQAGDLFKEKILSYIDRADLFVLCWSKNAAESDWVKIEREHALQLIREGKTTLSIYPLSLRPEAPLPIDMSDKYNFGKL